MTLLQLLTLVANRLDDTKEPYLWSDEELTSYANQRINELCNTIPIFVDTSTLAITVIPVIAGTRVYATDPRIIYINTVLLASKPWPLQRITSAELNTSMAGWRASSNTPSCFLTDFQKDTITLYPNPIVDDTLTLEVTRYPLSDLNYLLAETTSPEIPTHFHEFLVPGMTSLAYRKADAETENLPRVKADEIEWLSNIEKMKRFYLNLNYSPVIAAPHRAFM